MNESSSVSLQQAESNLVDQPDLPTENAGFEPAQEDQIRTRTAPEVSSRTSPAQEVATPEIESAQAVAGSPSKPDLSVVHLISKAEHSAGKLVNLLATYFPCFQDQTSFEGRRVRLLKRAQIFVADLWAAFGGTGYGRFDDIDTLTMFAGKSSL